jgi:ABC-type dipeptide/oligopeptide/nickel transport system permease subunit
MLHQIKQIMHSPKFVVGFVIFVFMFLFALIYPMCSPYEPMQMIGNIFYPPGTYVSVVDTATNSNKQVFDVDTAASNLEATLDAKAREKMVTWLTECGGIDPAQIDENDALSLVELWNEYYDPALSKGVAATKKSYERLNDEILALEEDVSIILASEEDGELVKDEEVGSDAFVNINDIANTITLPLGTDNFGADMVTKLSSSIRVSLQIGLMAGLIATAIGLVIGLLSGFLGGWIDNFLVFIMNLFTVIPSFVILILIANSVSQSARGPLMVAMIIGVTAWPWTARGVRAQVLSLRNRDHVNLSKLSGHSLGRIIAVDILPYVASYVVMAMILQISSGILSEAQLSMLGLGPSTAEATTLGLMMNWANKFGALTNGAWWAFLPVVLSIALISFSLNLMNTGLDQVFNPQLRDN